jgi:hypothetical protein
MLSSVNTNSSDQVEANRDLLAGTDWAALGHGYGSAAEAPKELAALLDADQGTRTRALSYIHNTLHHQNTLYEATVPAALYVAAILSDPRTTRTVDKDRHAFPGCMRAELLRWIASVASEVTDEAAVRSKHHGFPLDDYAPAVGIEKIRPTLFSASLPYTEEPDRHVSEAALTACIPLLDDHRLLHHRPPLVPLIRKVLGTSHLWQHRERAVDTLEAWGEDPSGLQGQTTPFLVCDSDPPADSSLIWPVDRNSTEGHNEELPF